MSTASGSSPAPRPRPPRRPPKRKIRLALALVLMGLALVAGIVVGYAARGGDSAPAGLVTESQTVPVVTVTVPASP